MDITKKLANHQIHADRNQRIAARLLLHRFASGGTFQQVAPLGCGG